MSESFVYFAYGSNLHPVRLRERTPSALVIGTAVLPGHRLRFHKLGRDGSAKCDAFRTGDPADRLYGALYRIPRAERWVLDRAESLGVGYDALETRVLSASGPTRAWLYVARREAIVKGLRPFAWYLNYVLSGARHHALPERYVRDLAATVARRDPDPLRAARNAAVVQRLARR